MNKIMIESEIESIATVKEAIFWFFGFIAVATFKILGYFMPKTYKAIIESIKKDFNKETLEEFKKLEKELKNLEKEMIIYKSHKHIVENANTIYEDAIIKNDKEKLKIIQEILKNEK